MPDIKMLFKTMNFRIFLFPPSKYEFIVQSELFAAAFSSIY